MEDLIALNISKSTNYLDKDILHVSNSKITEWDIRSAGFSVIQKYKLLSDDVIDKLKLIKDNKTLNITIGKLMLTIPELSHSIIEKLSLERQNFVKVNKIHNHEILSIKKDAIFLVDSNITVSKIDEFIEFRKKNEYTSYAYVDRKEFYYNSETDILHIKGISDTIESKCSGFLNDIKILLKSYEKNTHDDMFKFLKHYRDRYLNRRLEKESYRNLNEGRYIIGRYAHEDISDDMIEDVDISYNYINYILPLIQILLK